MNMKKSLLLLGVAAVVCLLVFADYARKPSLETGKRSVTGQVMEIQAFKGISPDTVSKIKILPPGENDPIVLEKDAGEWKVKAGNRLFRISKFKAEQLFGTRDKKTELKGPLTLEFQAHNPKSHADFNLTKKKATDVKFYNEKDTLLTDVLIGKSGTDWQTTYVRFPGQDDVYLAPIRLTDNFSGVDVNAWRDRSLFPDLKPDNVYKIHVDDRANTRSYTVVKRTGKKGVPAKWYVTEPFQAPARFTTANSMARTLTTLRAADFVTSRDLVAKAAFDHPTMIARFDIKDDPTTPVLIVGAESTKSKGQYYAKTNLSDEVYLIYKPYGLTISPDTLKETPTPTPSPTPTVSPTPGKTKSASGNGSTGKTGGAKTMGPLLPKAESAPAPLAAPAPAPTPKPAPASAK